MTETLSVGLTPRRRSAWMLYRSGQNARSLSWRRRLLPHTSSRRCGSSESFKPGSPTWIQDRKSATTRFRSGSTSGESQVNQKFHDERLLVTPGDTASSLRSRVYRDGLPAERSARRSAYPRGGRSSPEPSRDRPTRPGSRNPRTGCARDTVHHPVPGSARAAGVFHGRQKWPIKL
jgi:hypothetical protein